MIVQACFHRLFAGEIDLIYGPMSETTLWSLFHKRSFAFFAKPWTYYLYKGSLQALHTFRPFISGGFVASRNLQVTAWTFYLIYSLVPWLDKVDKVWNTLQCVGHSALCTCDLYYYQNMFQCPLFAFFFLSVCMSSIVTIFAPMSCKHGHANFFVGCGVLFGSKNSLNILYFFNWCHWKIPLWCYVEDPLVWRNCFHHGN